MSAVQDDWSDSMKRQIEDDAIGQTKVGKVLGAARTVQAARGKPDLLEAGSVFGGVLRKALTRKRSMTRSR